MGDDVTTPPAQIEQFADGTGLNYRHASLIMERHMMIGDYIPEFVKNSDLERYSFENCKMTFYFYDG